MKRLAICLLFVCLFASLAYAQNTTQTLGGITAAGSTCATAGACIVLELPAGVASASVMTTGTFSATATFEASPDPDPSHYTAITGYPLPSGAGASTFTAVGAWQFSPAGMKYLRVRGTSYSSGPIIISILGSTGSFTPPSSGGSGGSGGSVTQGTSPWVVSGTATVNVISGFATDTHLTNPQATRAGILPTTFVGFVGSDYGTSCTGSTACAQTPRIDSGGGVYTQGMVPHGTADSGNPHKVGYRAAASEITAVADGARTDGIATEEGAALVQPASLPGDQWQASSAGTPITTATPVLIHALKTGYYLSLSSLDPTNSSSTQGTEIQILQGTQATTPCDTNTKIIYDNYLGASSSGTGWMKGDGGTSFVSTDTVSYQLCIKTVTAGASVYWSAKGFWSKLLRAN